MSQRKQTDGGLRLPKNLRRVAVAAVFVGIVMLPLAASAAVPWPQADFNGYATGSVFHADALQSGETRLVDAEEAFSSASVNSDGLTPAIENEMQRVVSPASGNKNSYGRGSGIEVGLGQAPNAENQVIIAGKAEASAPPNTNLVTEEIGPVPADPLAYASAARGQAQARWDTGDSCILGADISFGLGFAADAQLLNTGEANADGSMKQPVVAADAPGPERAVSQSLSHTLLVRQIGAGGNVLGSNFGLMSEARMTIAPVTFFKGTDNEFTVEALGEWVFQAVATGLPGTANNKGAFIHYGPGQASPETPILRVIQGGQVSDVVKFQDIFTETGLVIPIPGVAEIAIGEDPRAIGGDAESATTATANGTEAAGAVDVVRVKLFEQKEGNTVTQRAADVRLGHMEARTKVPAGGISCELPVSKVAIPPSVLIGGNFKTRITVDNPYNCDLRNVRVEDRITTEQGARFRVVSTDPDADQSPSGSNLDEGTIVWNDIGPIGPGKSKFVEVTIQAQGGFGRIIDIAEATGTLANCRGEGGSVAGVAAAVEGARVSGQSPSVPVRVGAVAPLAVTGVGDKALAVGGAALLVSALALGALMRKRGVV